MINYLFHLCVLLSSSIIYGQIQNIVTPEIINPEDELIESFSNQTENNPMLFNGKVHTVHKTFSKELHTPAPRSNNFYYTFDKNKRLLKYDSDLKYDPATVSNLNREKIVSIQGDTIITTNEGGAAVFKKGHLQYILTSSIDNSFYANNRDNVTDSIVYQYKEDKLIGIYHYSKDVAEHMDGSYSVAVFYDLSHYKKATYNDENLLASIDEGTYELYEGHFVKKTSTYTYSEDALLQSFIKTRTEYEMVSLPEGGIDNLKTEPLKTIKSEKHLGSLDYLQAHTVLTLKDAITKKRIQEYSFRQFKNGTTMLYRENGLKMYQYDIALDHEKNPTQITVSSFVNQEKFTDEIITFIIDYY